MLVDERRQTSLEADAGHRRNIVKKSSTLLGGLMTRALLQVTPETVDIDIELPPAATYTANTDVAVWSAGCECSDDH